MRFTENIALLADQMGKDQLASLAAISNERLDEMLHGSDPSLSEVVRIAGATDMGLDRLVNAQLPGTSKRQVKMLVLDVDGVLSDGGMYVMEDGNEMKKFHTRDGRGIIELQKAGTEVAILSGSLNPQAIYKRAERLGVKRVFSGRRAKTEILEGWMSEMGIGYGDIAYVGDDLNDLEVIGRAGFSACPSNAVDLLKTKVDVILRKPGGGGCVREFIDDYLM